MYMREDQKRLNVYIPLDLYAQVEKCGYTATEAVVLGLRKLFSSDECNSTTEEPRNLNDGLVMSLQTQVKELQDHNETLKKELEDLKSMHNNYFLQMQTLINQRALEPPAVEKTKPWWQFWK
jgi:hypothetical protein